MSSTDSRKLSHANGDAIDSATTWAYLTKFVCHYEDLKEAKIRYQKVTDSVREKHSILFSSEQAYALGHSEPTFTLLLDEIESFGDPFTDSEKENYAVFLLVTIVKVDNMDDETLRDISSSLEIDWDEFPAKFPSRTRAIRVSESGKETTECIVQ